MANGCHLSQDPHACIAERLESMSFLPGDPRCFTPSRCLNCRRGIEYCKIYLRKEPDDTFYGDRKTHYCKMGHRKDRVVTNGRSYCKKCQAIYDKKRNEQRREKRREARAAR